MIKIAGQQTIGTGAIPAGGVGRGRARLFSGRRSRSRVTGQMQQERAISHSLGAEDRRALPAIADRLRSAELSLLFNI
jgi:hypothetical protein